MSDPELSTTLREMAPTLNDTGGPVVGEASLNPRGASGSYAANIVDVEVDPETGKVEILRYTAFQDAGTAIHPSYVEGQLQGGTVQGIGWALNEEYYMSDDGRMLNNSFLDYRMPTSLDVPMIDSGPHRGAESGASLRGARRRRGAHSAASGGALQRHIRRGRGETDRAPDVSRRSDQGYRERRRTTVVHQSRGAIDG